MNNNNVDQSNLRRVILEYPNQLQLGQKFATKIKAENKKYSNLIICGMGGSALPGDILASYLDRTKKFNLPITINRTYVLPKNATADSLILVCSYSGNTEETINCFEQALKLGSQVIAFSKGGKVKEMAEKNKTPWVQFKIDFQDFQPRYAATYVFAAFHQVLTNIGLCDRINKFPQIDSKSSEILGEELALKIKGKTPIIYASDKYKLLAKNWKIKINENAKTPAFWNYFPELNHNEMVGFTNPQSGFFTIMLVDEQDDHPKIQRRIEITASLYKKCGIESEIVKIKGKTFLEKILGTLVLGDWVSYYLALEYGQDPTPVEMVEDLKKKLKQAS